MEGWREEGGGRREEIRVGVSLACFGFAKELEVGVVDTREIRGRWEGDGRGVRKEEDGGVREEGGGRRAE